MKKKKLDVIFVALCLSFNNIFHVINIILKGIHRYKYELNKRDRNDCEMNFILY